MLHSPLSIFLLSLKFIVIIAVQFIMKYAVVLGLSVAVELQFLVLMCFGVQYFGQSQTLVPQDTIHASYCILSQLRY
jgi:hypothetical protein